MVAERLQAPNDWPLLTSPQKPGKSLPSKFLKIQFIPFALVCYPFPAPPVTAEQHTTGQPSQCGSPGAGPDG